eukprot:CAMPEP_0185786962 /NCGR_PEP_ID=MMETSP1174-20130828/138039_1 /TAXON_ID=35687 /ORGANISM="Dictyocha speculum, Strain CCMP1381" /LENGTH=72 /DNA_ID=CAMNT_0028479839 /DNA_START=1 /DNA_END=216 /DNA_ORIENTATION=-
MKSMSSEISDSVGLKWLKRSGFIHTDNPPTIENGQTPIYKACVESRVDICRWLSQTGISNGFDKPIDSGWTP